MSVRLCTGSDLAGALRQVGTAGGASLWMIPNDTLTLLQRVVHTCSYTEQPTQVGAYGVFQNLASCNRFDEHSPFHELRRAFEEYLNATVAGLPDGERPFPPTVGFTEMVLQKYPCGLVGITPHRDGTPYTDLIAVFTLCGTARVGICADRAGNGETVLNSQPGTVILLKAPGFAGATTDHRPFHFVSDITEERISLALRQKRATP